MYLERLQILLSKEQRRLLEQEAHRRGTSIAAVVRVALDRELGVPSRDDRANALDEMRAMRAAFVSPDQLNRIIADERDRVAHDLSAERYALTFFIDTNVIIYAATESEYREPCIEILEAVVSAGAGRTSTAVLEELWHIERSGRVAGLDGITDRAYRILTPLLSVTDRAVRYPLDFVAPAGLGINDRVHFGTCRDHGIDTIVTADAAFSGLETVRRVDPLDHGGRRALLE